MVLPPTLCKRRNPNIFQEFQFSQVYLFFKMLLRCWGETANIHSLLHRDWLVPREGSIRIFSGFGLTSDLLGSPLCCSQLLSGGVEVHQGRAHCAASQVGAVVATCCGEGQIDNRKTR